MDVQAVQDKLEIHELLARYARGVDTKDWELWKSVFTSDALVDYSSAGAPVGPPDVIAAWLEQGLQVVPMTQHFISNIEVDVQGDKAKVRALFYNPMQLPGMAEMSFCGGSYHHEMVRTDEGWKSKRLVEENVWFLNGPG
jgi:3-phenylpropionate/cinnamic acid dioxygenase small subunit